PYRKDNSKIGYRKITALAVLPSGPNMHVSPSSFAQGSTRKRKGQVVPCPDSGDFPYIYLGGAGACTIDPETGRLVGKYPMDAGLRYEPTDGNWNLFFLRSDGVFWVYDPDENPLYQKFKDAIPDLAIPPARSTWVNFAPGQTVSAEFTCTKDTISSKKVKTAVSLKVTGVDANTHTTKTLQVFTENAGYPQSGSGVSMKWVTSVGQYFPDNGDKRQRAVGFINSGTFMRGAGFDSVQVYDMTRAWYLSYSDNICFYHMTFPKSPGIISNHGTTLPFYQELGIWVDLTVNQ
ncbi:MAG: hypothetical protein M1305_04325, partial [Candidatus Marsarchaeota archaeon]|nr:hypothetical protein [Candidatus Marsarchaeota archaeon]